MSDSAVWIRVFKNQKSIRQLKEVPHEIFSLTQWLEYLELNDDDHAAALAALIKDIEVCHSKGIAVAWCNYMKKFVLPQLSI